MSLHMRFLITLITLLISTSTAVIAQTPNKSVRFDEKIHDFGSIGETDGKVTHRFVFTNTGRDTVTLTRARAGCSCVHAEVSRRPVLPGHTGYVDVTFDPDYRPGHFSKEIVVFSNGNRYNRIWVKGDVTPGTHPLTEKYRYDYGHGLLMEYKIMNFGTVPQGASKTRVLSFANNSTETLNLTFHISSVATDGNSQADGNASSAIPSGLIIDIPERYLLKPGAEGKIEVTVRMLAPLDNPATVSVTPVANGFTLRPLTLTVHPAQ